MSKIFFTAYGFYVTEFPELDYDVKDSYDLIVECVENSYPTATTSTGTIKILITENQPPSFTNLDSKWRHFYLMFDIMINMSLSIILSLEY